MAENVYPPGALRTVEEVELLVAGCRDNTVRVFSVRPGVLHTARVVGPLLGDDLTVHYEKPNYACPDIMRLSYRHIPRIDKRMPPPDRDWYMFDNYFHAWAYYLKGKK